MRFVSGVIANVSSGFPAGDLRMKYWTCEPGVSRPSGMIFVNSFVVAEPSQPVRDCGTVVSHAGTTPVQLTLLTVGELVAALVVSITKHLNLLVPSVANFGSLSWYIVIQPFPGGFAPKRPVPVGTAPPTGKMFSSVVSMRALFQVSGSHDV